MPLFRKRATGPGPDPAPASAPPPAPTTIAESIGWLVQHAGRPSLTGYTDFVKQVDCTVCGAAKRLPSRTAYLYCDHCGALIDYDFRAANLGTNAGITNTVFHALVAPQQAALNAARAAGDMDLYRSLYRPVYAEWLRQCPQAASPRFQQDPEFRERMIDYVTECSVRRDFDPHLAELDRQQQAATATLRRIPNGSGPWLVSDGFWDMAEIFMRHMRETYQMLEREGVLAMDPDQAPPGVPLRMEYSYFCQGFITHMRPADGERMLALFGLTGEYRTADFSGTVMKKCGGCGQDLPTVPGAKVVICEFCGRKLDIGSGDVPCQTCGALLAFPAGVGRMPCPYCASRTFRM
jgi:DNA-directed RNA polymerase subunit RPC12/RpoP